MRCVKVFATVALKFEKIFILLQCCVMWQTVMNLKAKAYSDEITLIGVCRDVTLVKVMAWCRQAIRHYLHPCCPYRMIPCGVITDHYNDVIMSAMASQITSLRIVYSIVYSGANKKTSKLRVTGLCAGNSPVTGEFPAQMASDAENVSTWWRHHADQLTCIISPSNKLQILIFRSSAKS